jgi:hypothetical protein
MATILASDITVAYQTLNTKLSALAQASQLNTAVTLPNQAEMQKAARGDIKQSELNTLMLLTATVDLLTALETREDAN